MREVVEVEVEVEEEGFGGALLEIGIPFSWSVVMVSEVGSVHPIVTLLLPSSMLSPKEVEVASALIYRGLSAL